MRRIKISHWLMGLAAVLTLAATAYRMTLTVKDDDMNTASADAPMHTLCVGRYLIDVPVSYRFEHYNYRIDGVDIEWVYSIKTKDELDAKVASRQKELSRERNETGEISFERAEVVDLPNVKGTVLYSARRQPSAGDLWRFDAKGNRVPVGGGDGGMSVESWAWVGEHAVKLAATLATSYVPSVAAMTRALQPLQVAQAEEPGFCMEMFDARAMIAGPPRAPDTYEGAEIQFGLEDHADVRFRLSFYPNLNDKLSEPLFAREAKAAERLSQYAGHFKKLRHQRRTVHGMDGEEIVEAVNEKNGTRSHSFDWEWLGRIKDPLAPQIELEAKTGYSNDGPKDSSLSDAAALKLWDAVVESIRLRPVTTAKTSQAAPTLALGSLVATGRPCPHTGWWDCAETSAPVRGGRRQFFHAGEPMPDAVLLGKPGLLQRIKGDAPTYRTATVWELVGYEAPPPPAYSAPIPTPAPAQGSPGTAAALGPGNDAPTAPVTSGKAPPVDKG